MCTQLIEEIDKTTVIAKFKATFNRPHIAELHDESSTSTEDLPCYDGTEASRSNTKLIKDKIHWESAQELDDMLLA